MKKIFNDETVQALYERPFITLLYEAQTIHQKHFPADEVELCSLLSVKTGACPEDCAYCPQSAHYETNVTREKLMNLDEVLKEARAAKENGALRFCMGAAWRNPPKKDFPKILEMIRAVKALGLETCVTLGMLDEPQAQALKEAGLDFYNHNLDTSPKHYEKIISTRTYQDRLSTLDHVRNANIAVCCGGILGMGESREDRIQLLLQLANLPKPPESIPINRLIPIPGTPLQHMQPLDNLEFIRTIAVTRIMMPNSIIRLSAGRGEMSEEMQALCFMAGANSMWLGEKLLTTPNPETNRDLMMLKRLGIKAKETDAISTH
ncbi:MAG: biotin synthase BioB [Gammaproteobacteria bacterium RIFCSPHIGHO2_12_FULL_38_14]|nr:MAG: biotin synthase BioB [Gammaproteobacteria bacterium RIFCSPHIGHO2_12_FULL_38_14]